MNKVKLMKQMMDIKRSLDALTRNLIDGDEEALVNGMYNVYAIHDVINPIIEELEEHENGAD